MTRMSRPAEFADVDRRIDEFGDRATVMTVTPDGSPHVVSAVIAVDGERLVTRVGSGTAANLSERPSVSLTWQPPPGGEYLLILDGTVEGLGDADADGVSEIAIRVDRGILHRLAGLPTSGPSCVAL